jgi:hypothetical protein
MNVVFVLRFDDSDNSATHDNVAASGRLIFSEEYVCLPLLYIQAIPTVQTNRRKYVTNE